MLPTQPNFYQILQVHPAAPMDLISDAYWRLVSHAQDLRRKEAAGDAYLYHLTKAYRTLSDPSLREQYDGALGVQPPLIAPELRPVRRSFFGRLFSEAQFDGKPDFYEIMRLDPAAEAVLLPQAYEIMRNTYIRLVRLGEAPLQLIAFLDEAYNTLSDPAMRAVYDGEREARAEPPPAGDNSTGGEAGGDGAAAATTAAAEETAAPTPELREPERLLRKPTTAVEEPRPVTGAPPGVQAAAGAPRGEARPPADGSPARSPDALPEEQPASAPRQMPPGIEALRRADLEAPPVSQGRDAASVIWDALAAVVAWLAEHVKRLWCSGVAWVRDALRAWREAAAEMSEERGLAKGPRILPAEEIPDEEEALISRLRAGANGSGTAAQDLELVAYLTLIHSPSGESTFKVDRSPLLLGSDIASDIPLPGMAPHEARLVYREGQFILFSLTDVQGIQVNGEAVAWAVLGDGTELGVGPYTLRFRLSADAA